MANQGIARVSLMLGGEVNGEQEAMEEEIVDNFIAKYIAKPSTLPMEKYIGEAANNERFSVLTNWLLQVATGLHCDGDVFLSAVEYLHEFLHRREVPVRCLQIAGATALLIASKMQETSPIPLTTLCYAADYSFRPEDIKAMEKRMLNVLEWDLLSHASPYDLLAVYLHLVCPELLADPFLREQVEDRVLIAFTELSMFGFGSVLLTLGALHGALAETQLNDLSVPNPKFFPHYQRTLLKLIPTVVPFLSAEKKAQLNNCFAEMERVLFFSQIEAPCKSYHSQDEGIVPSPGSMSGPSTFVAIKSVNQPQKSSAPRSKALVSDSNDSMLDSSSLSPGLMNENDVFLPEDLVHMNSIDDSPLDASQTSFHHFDVHTSSSHTASHNAFHSYLSPNPNNNNLNNTPKTASLQSSNPSLLRSHHVSSSSSSS